MAFLNKKEDVIDFQLTQYGKYLVSQGKFKPVYYAFFDDDIIYDQRYASGSVLEIQKDIETRIFDNTPSLDAQYLFHSVDDLKMQDQVVRRDSPHPWSGFTDDVKEKLQQVPEKYFTLTDPLGNSELATDKAPSFTIELSKGEISSSFSTLSGSDDKTYSIKNIPQINIKDIIFYHTIKNIDDEPAEGVYVFPGDQTYISVKQDYLSLRVVEENVPLSRENFDIEVYILDNSGNIDFPLYFKEDVGDLAIQNGILIDEAGAVTSAGDLAHYFESTDADMEQDLNAEMVEAYFALQIDGARANRDEERTLDGMAGMVPPE